MSPFGFLKKNQPEVEEREKADCGFLVFENTSEVIQAENLLKKKEWEIRVMGPPPEIRSGCDLVIEFPLIEELKITKILQDAGIPPLQAVPVTSPLLQPVDLFQIKDFGMYLMVQAANMKLTVEKESLTIVNISGGGCPDVPYLAEQMVGKLLNEAPSPRKIGHTLCGYALQLAYEEMRRRCSQL
ncbi:MAG: DUF3343 domain-containing protein [Thermodesulfobacteriota bacterium]